MAPNNKVVMSNVGRRSSKPTSVEDPPTRVSEKLPEGVDFSEGGWATDFAASLMGLLFMISSHLFYPEELDFFFYMFLGTFIAFFFGGLLHRFYPNRAADGVGNRGFYITSTLGYGGSCLRYGLGWGVPLDDATNVYGYIAAANFAFLVIAGMYVLCKMEHTSERIDNAQGMSFGPDRIYAVGEAFCAIMEVVTSIHFLIEVGFEYASSEQSILIYVAVGANVIGWAAVYLFALLYLVCGLRYDPSTMQRVFHMAMMVMMWALDAAVRSWEANN